jgi:Raf kinase inhibitor-like YbhB/YbcL family protein
MLTRPRALVLLVTSSLMIAGAALAAPSHAADPLLSRGKPVTTSSNESAALNGPKAVDGNATTRWASAEGSDPQWIRIDLGVSARISQVKLVWEAAYGRAYKIQASADGTAWTDLHDEKAGDGGTDDLAVNGTGRYVRMHGTARGTAYGYSLFEFEVYGSTGPVDTEKPTPPRNLRQDPAKPPTATTVSLVWDAATDNVGVAQYHIFQHGQEMLKVPGTQLSATVTGLTADTEYDWTVFALDATPNLSDASNNVLIKTLPSPPDDQAPTAPGNLRATGSTSTSVTLAWNPSTDNVGVTGYEIFKNNETTPTSTADGSATSTIVGNLAPNTEYTFTVKAKDAKGNRSPASNAATGRTTGTDPGGVPEPGQVTDIIRGVDVPWGMGFLPDGSALVTERNSFNVFRLTESGQRTNVGKVTEAVGTNGEGGLMGLEISPNFATDNYVYIMHTAGNGNRIVRAKFENNQIGPREILLQGIPKSRFHNGGRLRFGPDGKLWATTGDAQNGDNAQNLNNNAGKILRINPDGSIPADNPFAGKAIWSYGHRNVQGLDFDSRNRPWASEFGQSSQDEINLIVKGGNYGWPDCEGNGGSCGNALRPKWVKSTGQASPSGLTIINDHVFVATTVGQRVYRLKINGDSLGGERAYFQGQFGRLRTVEVDHQGDIWLTSTLDKDGTANNDRIVHVDISTGPGGPTDPPPGEFKLTSPAFAHNGNIPNRFTCAQDKVSGNDISPELVWGAGPAGTKSYAITFIDTANGGKHWAIWDIPAAKTGLPEGLGLGFNVPNQAPAKQKAMSSGNKSLQFFGPCPGTGNRHRYEFTLYALNVETLPGLSQSSSVAAVETAALARDISGTKLAGNSAAGTGG